MKRVVIHIGTTKTGSTSLQSFFASNRELLAEEDVLYYEPLHRYLPWTKPSNGDFLLYMTYARLGVKFNPDILGFLNEEAVNVKRAFSSFDTLLFSEEVIWERSFLYNDFWAAMKDVLEDLFGSNVKIDIAVYLRRQDNWIYSFWKQRAPIIAVPMEEQFDGFLKYMLENRISDYAYGVSRITRAFGKNSMIIRSYDKLFDGELDIFNDFVSSTGMPPSIAYRYPAHFLNPSVTYEAAEASVWIKNNKKAKDSDLTWLRSSALLYSDLYPEKQAVYPTDTNERQSILSKYAAGNLIVAKEFCNLRELFSDSIPDYAPCLYDAGRAEKNARTLIKLSKVSKEALHLIKQNPAARD